MNFNKINELFEQWLYDENCDEFRRKNIDLITEAINNNLINMEDITEDELNTWITYGLDNSEV